MKMILEHERACLLHGNSEELGDVLPENSIDSIVCDPPGALGFMSQKWDSDRGGYDQWTTWLSGVLAPSFHALKPGGHALFWALPRTGDWTMRAVRLAGFEIRDVHHDVIAGDTLLQAFLETLTAEQQQAFARLSESQEAPIYYHLFGSGMPKGPTSKSDAIPEGTGTLLKPAVEHWILARKPLDGTIAQTHATWGTGVVNIGACSINGGNWPPHLSLQHADDCVQSGVATENKFVFDNTGETSRDLTNPANYRKGEQQRVTTKIIERATYTCAPGCPVAELDSQSGVLTSGSRTEGVIAQERAVLGSGKPRKERVIKGSKGGASRFFYCSKAARSEKDAGLDHLTPSTGGEATGREDGSAGVDNPRAGAGRTGGARNSHPTCKSIALMSWLVRLVTPPGGTVLDPFAGSGTTGVAALKEGMNFIGCEQGGEDDAYIPILLGRIRHALGLPQSPESVT